MKNKNLKYYFIIFMVALLLMAIQIGSKNYYNGVDSLFHMSIIASYKDAFLDGDFFPRILSSLGHGIGYGTTFFYATLTHYIAAFLSLFFEFFPKIP